MIPASWPRPDPTTERLLVLDPVRGAWSDAHIADLGGWLRPGDLLVVNDAATLPASLPGQAPDGAPVEVRLASALDDGSWRVALFGAGDWHTDTDARPLAPDLPPGALLRFDGLTARVVEVEVPRRLLRVRFDREGDAWWRAIYRIGRPVQYRHVAAPLPLWHVQTPYAARPWAMEIPAAGRPLTGRVLDDLRRRGVAVAPLTHAAGLSALGDPALDATLPFPERAHLPAATVAAVQAADRVIAVGTSVVRALEGNVAANGRLVPGTFVTDLKIGPHTPLRVVDGLLTGQHDPSTSHDQLLQAFAPRALLRAARAHAEAEGYLGHEFGDSTLLLAA